MIYALFFFFFLTPWTVINALASNDKSPKKLVDPALSISANAAAVDITTGTGALGKALRIRDSSGIRLGGMVITDMNMLLHGGSITPPRHRISGDGLLILSLNIDLSKVIHLPGGSVEADFLQFNGKNVNEYAGCAQGYNSLPGPLPLKNRSQLYELWYRQTLFKEKLIIRMGKTVPTYDFNNVIRPIVTQDNSLAIPAVTGLIYTPVFVNSSMLGVMPGYYNSAYGLTVTALPLSDTYFSYGIYDGNLARGVQTGLKAWPTFNSYRFNILEGGRSWTLGSQNKPGMFAFGGWLQTGILSTGTGITENGAKGLYLFGSQRLWLKNPAIDSSGISMFYQFGVNNSVTLPFKRYLGFGATAFSLIPHRPQDSMGTGMALAWLNPALFTRTTECMLQGYYQAYLTQGTYFVGALSYIPNPGIPAHKKNAIAITARLIALF